ncbi:unnamed protein product [Trichogramma brassicae]|uniref:Uncharacterized protein n=1 Tax=Trichogramma brassicae TaxID=86971 RepID=A0A6H5IBD1_9HYME|nr:unnamed protein product [Trichogramma brassicae]
MLISRSATQYGGAFSNLRRLPRIDFSPKSRVLGIALMNYRRSSPRARGRMSRPSLVYGTDRAGALRPTTSCADTSSIKRPRNHTRTVNEERDTRRPCAPIIILRRSLGSCRVPRVQKYDVEVRRLRITLRICSCVCSYLSDARPSLSLSLSCVCNTEKSPVPRKESCSLRRESRYIHLKVDDAPMDSHRWRRNHILFTHYESGDVFFLFFFFLHNVQQQQRRTTACTGYTISTHVRTHSRVVSLFGLARATEIYRYIFHSSGDSIVTVSRSHKSAIILYRHRLGNVPCVLRVTQKVITYFARESVSRCVESFTPLRELLFFCSLLFYIQDKNDTFKVTINIHERKARVIYNMRAPRTTRHYYFIQKCKAHRLCVVLFFCTRARKNRPYISLVDLLAIEYCNLRRILLTSLMLLLLRCLKTHHKTSFIRFRRRARAYARLNNFSISSDPHHRQTRGARG